MSNHPSPINLPKYTVKEKKNIFKNDIDIEYKIPLIDYNGMMYGDIKTVCNNFINMIEEQIISKHTDLEYYIQGEYDDYLPSPFSHSNTVRFIVENIFYNLSSYDKKNMYLKLDFFQIKESLNFLIKKNTLRMR